MECRLFAKNPSVLPTVTTCLQSSATRSQMCEVRSLLQCHLRHNYILFTDFNNLKQNYIIVCFNFSAVFEFLSTLSFLCEFGGQSPYVKTTSACHTEQLIHTYVHIMKYAYIHVFGVVEYTRYIWTTMLHSTTIM